MIDPTLAIGEILGEPAAQMRNPVNAGYQCPFIGSQCTKSGGTSSDPYPICSVNHRPTTSPRLIAVCPKRFFEAGLRDQIIQDCWPGDPPENPRLIYDVILKGYGRDEFVIADVEESGHGVRSFVSVKVHAADITGSVEPAFNAILNSRLLSQLPSYGINWANVRKRFLSQVIAKGFHHSTWGSRIISIIQSPVYEYLRTEVEFDESVADDDCNVIFMVYDFEPSSDADIETAAVSLTHQHTVRTSYESLMYGAACPPPPPPPPPARSAFVNKLIERLQK